MNIYLEPFNLIYTYIMELIRDLLIEQVKEKYIADEILEMKYQMEHADKMKKTFGLIKLMAYKIEDDNIFGSTSVSNFYDGTNHIIRRYYNYDKTHPFFYDETVRFLSPRFYFKSHKTIFNHINETECIYKITSHYNAIELSDDNEIYHTYRCSNFNYSYLQLL